MFRLRKNQNKYRLAQMLSGDKIKKILKELVSFR